MSQRNKLSLWQKIKRFLTTSAPQPTNEDGNKSTVSSHLVDSANLKTRNVSTQNKEHDNERLHVNASEPITKKHERSDTPIVDVLKHYFDEKQWHYTYYRPKTHDGQQSHHLSLRMQHQQLNCGYLFRVQEKTKLLAVYGILPFLIPETHQSAAMLLITQLNYDMLIGNLEIDINDGEIRYKYAIDVEAVGINNEIIDHLLQSTIAMITVANELFSNLVSNQDPAEDLQTLLIELREQTDARTFFLPTQFVQ
ncbi:YbjN domain-containing protein [Psychrobacter sp. B38]|uniref:YbjN domain-containing protein n=1 Tax=Psychrobacter sp. B38 TaxID=3143538 RepID=UPI0032113E3B